MIFKLNKLSENEVKEFFYTVFDAAERALRSVLFMSPEEFNFKKNLTTEEIDFWIRKVSLVIIAYSYYYFSIKDQKAFIQFSYIAYWQRMFDSYNKIFEENIETDNILSYSAGLKEDEEKGYSKAGNIDMASTLAMEDYKTIGYELMKKIWPQNAEFDEKKFCFLEQEYGKLISRLFSRSFRSYYINNRSLTANNLQISPR